MKKPLSERVLAAGTLQISGKFFGRGLDLLTLIILSRLLMPADFGLTALGVSIVSITEAVTQLPLAQALVTQRNPSDSLYNTAFTLALLRGLLLAFVLAVVSIGMAYVYSEPRLVTLVMALSLAPVLRGLVSPRMVVFMREIDFRRDIFMEVAGKTVAFCVSTLLAVTTHSYWAIASATIATPLTMFCLSYIFAPGRPSLTVEHWQVFKGVFGWNSLAQLFSAMNWQMDKLLLGQLISRTSLGRYAMAADINSMVTQSLISPLGGPLLAAYARRSESGHNGITDTHLKATNALLALGGPVFIGVSLLAHQVVLLILGPSWEETSFILQWLALTSIVALPVIHLGSLAFALNKVRLLAFRTGADFVVTILALTLGGYYAGLIGVVIGRAVSASAALIIGMYTVKQLIGCSIASQVFSLHRTIGSLAIQAVVVLMLRPFIPDASMLAMIVGLALVSLAGALTYVLAIYGFWLLERRPAGIEKVVWERAAALIARYRK